MGRKKQKPVAKCSLHFRRTTTTGWGDPSDESQVQDYGEAKWEPDPEVQIRSRPSFSPPRRAAIPRFPVAPPRTPTPSRAVTRRRGDTPFCTLVFLVPPCLEFIGTSECRSLWPDCHLSFGRGKVYAPLKRLEYVVKALEMRSALGCRIEVMKHRNVFGGWETTQALMQGVQNQASQLPWIGSLQSWALLSEDGHRFDPSIDIELWFPPPSFNVQCQTPNGDLITNYDEVSKAFVRGVQQTFKRWLPNPNSPDIDIILETEDSIHASVLIDIKRCAVESPFCIPGSPLNDPAVANALLHIIKVAPGEIVLNCTCSEVDVVEELLQVTPGLAHPIVCDVEAHAVRNALHAASSWSDLHEADGNQCDLTNLPFRDGSVDVVVAMMHVSSEGRNVNRSKILSKRLQEMARVCRLETGRVCFLTDQDDVVCGLLNKRVNWSSVQDYSTAFGRFTCKLYLLQRSASPFPSTSGVSSGMDFMRRGRGRSAVSTPVPPGMSPSRGGAWDREEMEWDDCI